jgi:uncharacterized CHY-type Zn-finger protein
MNGQRRGTLQRQWQWQALAGVWLPLHFRVSGTPLRSAVCVRYCHTSVRSGAHSVERGLLSWDRTKRNTKSVLSLEFASSLTLQTPRKACVLPLCDSRHNENCPPFAARFSLLAHDASAFLQRWRAAHLLAKPP